MNYGKCCCGNWREIYIQPKDITFQCQANGLKNISAYFYFSETFIIIPYKRSEIRRPLDVISLQ